MKKIKPVSPGEMLEEEFLKPYGLTKYRLAKEIGVPPQRIGDIVAGKRAIMNMIPYNAVDGLPYARPADDRCVAIARQLHQRGVLTKLRQSAGQDIDGGCGQLRARQTADWQPFGGQRRPLGAAGQAS